MEYILYGIGVYCVVVWVFTSIRIYYGTHINTEVWDKEKEKLVNDNAMLNAMGKIPKWILVVSIGIYILMSPIAVLIPSKEDTNEQE